MAGTNGEHPTFAGSVIWDSVVDPDTGESFSIVVDPSRETLVTVPVPEDLDHYYTPSYHGNRHGFTAKYCNWRRVRIMRRAIRCRQRRPRQLRHIDSRLNIQDHSGVPSVVNWLDVGCGEGTLLQRIALQGWRVRGVERFPHLARERGLTVFDSLEQAASEGPYDGVSLWHVLEHLADPAKTLSEIHSLLDPDGVLIIAAPDAGSFAARWFGPHWMHWDVPRHLFHFSRDSLCRLLCDCGFDSRQLAVSEFEYDLMGFGQSVLNRLGMRQNMFFRILTGRRVPLSPLAKCMHLVFGASICAIASVPIWLYGRLGRGGTLVFEARPSSSK